MSVDFSVADSGCWRDTEPDYSRASHSELSAPALPRLPLPRHDFQTVYAEHFSYVCSALRRQGVHEQDVQDLAQQVFIVVHVKLPRFEYRAALRTWLFRICINAARDYRRAAPKRREVATEPAELNSLSGSRDDVHEQSDARRRVGLAEGILNRLPKARREVFVLVELEQMSGSEAASTLGIALGTVRSRLRLARSFLMREGQRLSVNEP